MHLIDFMWGVLSICGAAVPVYRLYDNLHRPGAPYLLSLVSVCAIYPWAYIVYPYTFFDQGLVFAFTVWIGPLYLLGVVSYLTIRPPAWLWIRNGTLGAAAGLSITAITNPLHGVFATFKEVSAAEPLTTTGQITHGIGMSTMGGFSIACLIASMVLVGFHYSRARFNLSHLLAITLFPLASGLAYFLQDEIKNIGPDNLNLFILCTTAGLGVLTYSLLRSRFLEIRPIARELVLNLIPDAMAIVGTKGVVIDCNPQFAGLLGQSMRTTIGMELNGILPETAWTLGSESEATRCLELEDKRGSRFFEVHLVSLDQNHRHPDILVLLRDTTEQTLAHKSLQENQAELHALNKQLARLSNTDSLTGLNNRRHFHEQLNQEYERAARHDHDYALLSIDLDDFKNVNDTYGHAVGDQALMYAARALESQCRTADTLARVGGEEFMVLLLSITREQLRAVAERFRQAIDRSSVPLEGGLSVKLTASIGAVLIPPNVNAQTALRQVDDALYAAKRAGRNQVVIHDLPSQATG